ncbi:MAG: DUF3108 domain-containing protein [Burkholderiales bacterium]|nr:DUF3108 domain-containing protein [Burkholderiales bacterium]
MAELAFWGAAVPTRARHPLLRRKSGWLLLAIVTLVHVVAVDQLAVDRFGWGVGDRSAPRIEVAFVRELNQSAPPAREAPATKAPTAPAAATALPAVASAPLAIASAPTKKTAPEPAPPPAEPRPPEPVAPPPPVVAGPPPVTPAPEGPAPRGEAVGSPSPPQSPPLASSEPALVAANAPLAQAFDWPPSTRLSYALNGYFRGPMKGSAQVDWLRAGSQYQVHLETSIGGGFFSRRIRSDGELGERGLAPRRFEGEQKLLFRAPRRWAQQFGPERATLGDGNEVPMLPGTQDEASQFVQLTWLFTTQPQLLKVGNAIEVPLAINKRIDRWIYDIKEEQTLYLPFGEVRAFYVKPRREAAGGVMTAEMWFAPSLQYLPVRILIRQDEATYVDLTLEKPPMQATTTATK